MSKSSLKRASASQSDETDQETIEVEAKKQHRIGCEDYISHLPDLSLLAVCRHLTRNDIYNFTRVNHRMLPIADDRSLDKIKRECEYLNIVKTDRGYGFAAGVKYNANEDTIYLYEIFKIEEDEYNERKAVNESFKLSSSNSPHNWIIPSKFFIILKEFLRHHKVKNLRLRQVPFDELFFNQLRSTFDGHTIPGLYCWRMTSEEMTNEDRISFARFISRVKSVDIKESRRLCSVVNEAFIREIIEAESLREFINDFAMAECYEHRFHLDESILPRLFRLSVLQAEAMIIESDRAVNLIMMFIDAMSANTQPLLGRWKFGVNNPITTQMILQQIRADYQYAATERHIHYIYRKDNRISSTFRTAELEITAGVIARSVDVIFNRPRSSR